MEKLRVALLSGGISSERQVSLDGGVQVFDALDKEKYSVVRYDPAVDLLRLTKDAPKIDVALLILHGEYGEDGTIQGMLDMLNIPYQGSGVLGSAAAMNKLTSKILYEKKEIPTPHYLVFDRKTKIEAQHVIETLGLPLVVKPAVGGSSIGMTIARSKDHLKNAFDLAFEHSDSIILEKYITGIELTCGVIGNHDPDPLPVIEIIPGNDHTFFDYEAKYKEGATEEICPARIDDVTSARVQEYAKLSHQALFCKGYSRTDMILQGNDIYILETNTIPGMTATSLLPRSAKASGLSYGQLLDKLILLAMENHKDKKTN